MNNSQLRKLGVPDFLIAEALAGIRSAAEAKELRGYKLKQFLPALMENPAEHADDPHFGPLATAVMTAEAEDLAPPPEPIGYRTWGDDIDAEAHKQMREACSLPSARGAALMPDAHLGYGLPIGGVLGLENAVVPYAVGVDIACRIKLSVLDVPAGYLEAVPDRLETALNKGTRFGVGSSYGRSGRQHHPVMDQDWSITRITRENKDKAWAQLGSSGSGNHFAEFGLLTLNQRDEELGLEKGEYLALLSHSGSRGVGAAVCSTYSAIARNKLGKRQQERFGRLAWLDMDSQEGQEYWAAMNLMGDYAAANHAVLHKNVMDLIGAKAIAGVENHHNFAWKETHGGKEIYVHRKGATPAGAGVLGVIPGSMADPAFIVRGKGNAESLDSASHGAGRRMSRTKAKAKYTFGSVKKTLAERGVRVISAGSDEVPGVYKNIRQVMAAQTDLVDVVARFDPRVVKMCGDGSRAED
ncbi:RtcB family protein [Alienimonas californiensis]|uniref:3'-phosphate/5'-hydroxy nucleic acid ligase n=1 Tax=Alienimonas californiensis TaxID=2527989 RepID=A0A517PAD8_9PLAN|nr:RNA-splicing ligase RtcB [Alienimonas californiensis]